MIEIGEQPREIPTQGKVSTAKSFMDVAPLPLALIAVCALLQEFAPSFVPFIECCCEFLSCSLGESAGDTVQFSSCFKLRTLRELLRDRLQLMELALLDGNLGIPLLEHLSNTFPPIDGERFEPKSRCFQRIETTKVVLHFLTRDLHPVQVPSVGATDKHTVRPGEKCCIHDEIHRLLFDDDLTAGTCMSIEIFSECLGVFAVRFTEIVVRLSPFCVIVVGTYHPSFLLSVLTNNYVFAHLALVPLSARLPTIFPKGVRAA